MNILETDISQTLFSYLPAFRKTHNFIYLIIIFFIAIVFSLLPFVYINISISSQGMIRPRQERTEVKSIVSGIIDSLFYKEGDTILKNSIVLRLKDDNSQGKRIVSNFEISQRQQFIHDLQLLSDTLNTPDKLYSQLLSPLYKEQLSRFIHLQADQEASLRKSSKELEINDKLLKERVISAKEYFDIEIQYEKMYSTYRASKQEQLSLWQQDLAKYKLDLSQYQDQLRQVNTNATYYYVKSPTAGIIQNINTRYEGGLLQANETICSVSPLGTLVAECYVPSKDIGLIREGQSTQFQIDAFDYNYFGIVTGNVISIDKDFTIVDNKPVFKVRCLFDSTQMRLKNGYTAELGKGLTFQARFIVARRNLWQLLWDKIDNWLNPASPQFTS